LAVAEAVVASGTTVENARLDESCEYVWRYSNPSGSNKAPNYGRDADKTFSIYLPTKAFHAAQDGKGSPAIAHTTDWRTWCGKTDGTGITA